MGPSGLWDHIYHLNKEGHTTMKEKLAAALAALLLLGALAGCGGKTASGGNAYASWGNASGGNAYYASAGNSRG